MAQEMANRGRTALVFRSKDGLDELSSSTEADIWQVSGGKVTKLGLNPTDIGIFPSKIESLIGGDAHHNASVASKLFAGEGFANSEPIGDVVVLNAAAGMVAYELAKDPSQASEIIEDRFKVAIAKTRQALADGKAQQKLVEWSAATQQF
jgi:anthranilate phosphoribosyltransferase